LFKKLRSLFSKDKKETTTDAAVEQTKTSDFIDSSDKNVIKKIDKADKKINKADDDKADDKVSCYINDAPVKTNIEECSVSFKTEMNDSKEISDNSDVSIILEDKNLADDFHPDEGVLKPGEIADDGAISFDEDAREKGSWLSYLKNRLVKMRLEELLGEYTKIDDDFMEGLEEILISSDLGVKTTQMILDHFEEIARIEKINDSSQLMDLIKEVLLVILDDEPSPLNIKPGRLNVILTIGVNGVGKTTTIGKMAARFNAGGKKVMLAAGDTFRAGAIEQLEVWGRRASSEVIRYNQGGDAAAVVFDAIKAAKARNVDVLIVDTAGRLHNKFNLMEELAKIKRIISREIEGAPHETLLVIDANTGQNGVAQAKVFKGQTDVSGIVLTKIDGTAKGGVTVAIKEELRIPVKLIGIGEQINDLRVFRPKEFVRALMGE
jgi:fused signal recognition particle receptor